ncbi:hypothetical protein BDV34DRAFT_23597 [Aspergillus parasiticus]|uniref:Uncharacterized protein n=1 Tax=Aspergillus parasiticus TaxID=5067 RepID=A0A5N6D6Y5_ASPPA|nr:hypothetical protein BDV34DRAFT_23597 [Aspergillus parasiticus]
MGWSDRAKYYSILLYIVPGPCRPTSSNTSHPLSTKPPRYGPSKPAPHAACSPRAQGGPSHVSSPRCQPSPTKRMLLASNLGTYIK